MNPYFELNLLNELVTGHSFPFNCIDIYMHFCVNYAFNPNRWSALTKLSASPSPLSDDDDVALITVEMEPGNDEVITTKANSLW